MSYRDKLHAELERDAFAAEARVGEIKRQLKAEANEGARAVLKLRLQDAHTEHQRCLTALFAAAKL